MPDGTSGTPAAGGRTTEINGLLDRIERAAGEDAALDPGTVRVIQEQAEFARQQLGSGGQDAAARAVDAVSLIKESAAANDAILLAANNLEALLDELQR